MRISSIKQLGLLAALALSASTLLGNSARADLVVWNIDSALSKISLAIPDSLANLDGTSVTVRIRNQSTASGGTNVWNVGNTANMDGTIQTFYEEIAGNKIQFLTNAPGAWVALDSGSYRPNPASFNSDNTGSTDENPDGQYQNSTTSPAAFGARALASVGVTVNAGMIAIKDVSMDATSGELPTVGALGNYTFDPSTMSLGILAALIDFDGLALPLGLGQPIPDTLDGGLNNSFGVNSLAGPATITNTGGFNRQLTIPVVMSIPVLDLGEAGGILFADVVGQIVANAVVPEPSAIMMAGVGLGALAYCAATRHRRRRNT